MLAAAIIKTVEYLKDTGVKKTREELDAIINEPPEYVNKALEKLIAIDVVTEEERDYLYHAIPGSSQFSTQLDAVRSRSHERNLGGKRVS